MAIYFGLNPGDVRVKKAVFLNALKEQSNENDESQMEWEKISDWNSCLTTVHMMIIIF